MNVIAFSNLKSLKVEEVLALLPMVVTVNAEPAFMLDKLENMITTSDLHPRVRTMLKAMERRARVGMPPQEHIYTEQSRNNKGGTEVRPEPNQVAI